ncbi:unnamed protein product, partial [Rotaria sp. Silwood2]
VPIVPVDARWSKIGVTVAGGNGRGMATNQLNGPLGLFIDDDQTMIIADTGNHRVMQWTVGDKNGQVVAGGNGRGNDLHRLDSPIHALIDKATDSLLICDRGNRRVLQWSRHEGTTHGEILLNNISCCGLAMDDQRYLYVSDVDQHEVRRYKVGERNGIVVAGGHGKGFGLHQLNDPFYIFVDREQTVYVSETSIHRVVKWYKGAKEGIIAAGGHGVGNTMLQFTYPEGLFVDALGTVYVADQYNHRVMRWTKGASQGTIAVGEYGKGATQYNLNMPYAVSLGRYGDLYVVDNNNNRIQRFSLEKNI